MQKQTFPQTCTIHINPKDEPRCTAVLGPNMRRYKHSPVIIVHGLCVPPQGRRSNQQLAGGAAWTELRAFIPVFFHASAMADPFVGLGSTPTQLRCAALPVPSGAAAHSPRLDCLLTVDHAEPASCTVYICCPAGVCVGNPRQDTC